MGSVKLLFHLVESLVGNFKNDDYNHEMPARQNVIACSYLEVHKDVKNGTIYYIEQKKKAITSTSCVGRVFPTLEIGQEKHCRSMQDMYLLTHDTNEAVLGLLSE